MVVIFASAVLLRVSLVQHAVGACAQSHTHQSVEVMQGLAQAPVKGILSHGKVCSLYAKGAAASSLHMLWLPQVHQGGYEDCA